MVDAWGSWVANFGSKRIRLGATIVPYVFADRVDFYLGMDLQSEYEISDTSNKFSISGNWSRSASSISVSTPSGGGTDVLWSEAVSSGHLYRVYGSPGQTLTASVSSYIEDLFQDNKRASVTYSESATIPAVVPTAPGVSSSPGNGFISVSYSAPSYNGGATITSYQYSVNGGAFTNTPSNPFNVNGANGTAITVAVRAVNSAGAGPSASTSNTPRTVPTAPTSFAANNATFGQLALSWAAPSSNGGATVTGYTLKRGATTLLTNANQTTYTDTGLSPNTSYTYTVQAVNVAGTGTAATISPTTLGGIGRVWNGSTHVTTLPKVWNGTAWVDSQARIWNGTEWKYGI